MSCCVRANAIANSPFCITNRKRCCLRITLDYIIPGKIGNISPALLSNNNNFPTPNSPNRQRARVQGAFSQFYSACVCFYTPQTCTARIS